MRERRSSRAGLPGRGGVAPDIEQVVLKLERHADRAGELSVGVLHGGGGVGGDGA